MQIGALQIEIDNLYNKTFANITVTYTPESSSSEGAAQVQDTAEESFQDMSEATFGLLGRQRQRVMTVLPSKLQLVEIAVAIHLPDI